MTTDADKRSPSVGDISQTLILRIMTGQLFLLFLFVKTFDALPTYRLIDEAVVTRTI